MRHTLQKLKYDFHTKLPLNGIPKLNLVGSYMIPVAIWYYEYHTLVFAVQYQRLWQNLVKLSLLDGANPFMIALRIFSTGKILCSSHLAM